MVFDMRSVCLPEPAKVVTVKQLLGIQFVGDCVKQRAVVAKLLQNDAVLLGHEGSGRIFGALHMVGCRIIARYDQVIRRGPGILKI